MRCVLFEQTLLQMCSSYKYRVFQMSGCRLVIDSGSHNMDMLSTRFRQFFTSRSIFSQYPCNAKVQDELEYDAEQSHSAVKTDRPKAQVCNLSSCLCSDQNKGRFSEQWTEHKRLQKPKREEKYSPPDSEQQFMSRSLWRCIGGTSLGTTLCPERVSTGRRAGLRPRPTHLIAASRMTEKSAYRKVN